MVRGGLEGLVAFYSRGGEHGGAGAARELGGSRARHARSGRRVVAHGVRLERLKARRAREGARTSSGWCGSSVQAGCSMAGTG